MRPSWIRVIASLVPSRCRARSAVGAIYPSAADAPAVATPPIAFSSVLFARYNVFLPGDAWLSSQREGELIARSSKRRTIASIAKGGPARTDGVGTAFPPCFLDPATAGRASRDG